ncbi:uncharacterized protein LOC134273514 [Saccostrea cucullata]|uniref:uncharacterized protein LOC134273514 n=1 Tax=Saccostrea cuccullata TaxID=36930 RepID=UPI002ED1870A
MFETYQTTLMRDPNSMLAIRFSGRHDPVMVDGAHFFDRDPKYFDYILNYLRDGNITADILPRNKEDLHKILKEADYYQLLGLKEEVEKVIQQSSSNIEEAAKMSTFRDQSIFIRVPRWNRCKVWLSKSCGEGSLGWNVFQSNYR